ncbi:DUF362 domain-containing protein [Candidatus Bathyarchaeota archaeon]|jgi:uncharacterized protein (DUF362 family)|nr:DUF362 domain-containing protein [Candidatus Bathyarchaeota archaeon]MBT4320358.1 DUF362 domain-containing protein [Candidatus Bathyarchaeota archaeon]MBT4424403.1 DUF362 domain-containing protein [Candidatus Bathyarchaeota archaeon]MBT6605546.1 DUF362 domain-containing protein [Candidatus Bathyarchaeota archaeon]MBT7187860.1 DUF362 domain-containing protein [Candidatus Bathyarchaeota archaeon]
MSVLRHRSRVAIVKGTNHYETTKQALGLVIDEVDVEPDDRVLIKPNCVSSKPPNTGVTTDSRVVEPIIEFLREKGVHDIVIGEGGNPGTKKTFRITGLKDLAKRQGVELINLNKDKWEELPIPGSVAMNKVKIARTVLECDRIINVPKLKIHHMAQVTLSLKNLMGVVVDKRGQLMHHKLHEKIVDLASLFTPALNVVDGIVGAERDEVVGSPIESNVIIAGVDMVSVDAIGSAVMGLDPLKVSHIQQAAERGLGISSLNYIDVLGDTLESVRRKFSTEYSDEKLESYGLSRPLSEEDITNMMSNFTERDPRVKNPYAKK